LEGVVREMPRGRLPGVTVSNCHVKHAKIALYPHSNSSCSVAIALHGYRSVNIDINERR